MVIIESVTNSPMLLTYLKQESHRKFKFNGNIALDRSNLGSKFEVKMSEVRVTRN